MLSAPLLPDEAHRLAVLHRLGILDSAPDAEFDALARAASSACGVPIAVIGLMDRDREWFKAQVGLPGATEAPRGLAFCAHAILQDDLMEVEDAREDPRFADNPAVLGAPHVRFYAAAPLRLSDGSAVGALCVVDDQPRRLTDAQRETLRCLGQVTAKALEYWTIARQQALTVGELRSSEERLRRLYETTPAMLHSSDEAGALVRVSDTWLAKLGYARDQVVGRSLHDFLTPQSKAYSERVVRPRYLATGACKDVEFQMVRKDGVVLDVLMSATAERDGDGRLRRSLSVIEDVTLRRATERALATEHQRLANILQSTGLGTWEWNVQTGAVRCNERWAAMLGTTLDALAPLSIDTRDAAMHPADRASSRACLERHLAGATPRYETEFRVQHSDGQWAWMLESGAVISRTENGLPEWLFATRKDITAAKLQAEALRKSEDFLERTGAAAGVGGWELDLVTHEVHWSAETRRIHGVAPDYQPTLETAIDFYAPEAQPLIQAAVERAIAEGQGWDLELPLVRLDGTRIWARAVGHVSFEDGRPVRLSGAFQDVTERANRELALQGVNERMKLATESGGIGVWQWYVGSDTSEWDECTYRLYGLTPEDGAVTYELWSNSLHPDDRAMVAQAVQDALDGTRPYDIEVRAVWRDGSLHHVRTAGRVSRDAAGRPASILGVTWDVTEARQLMAELARQSALQAEASERERALFRNSPDMLCVLRVEEAAGARTFRFEAVSPACERITGLRPEDLVGQRVGFGLPESAARVVFAACEECVDHDSTTTFALALDRPNGLQHVEGTRTPIRSPGSGRILRIAGTMRDVTERKRLEALEHHGQKMDAIGNLAAGVAHDFNNVLQSITGSLEVLQDTVEPGTTAHKFAAIGLRAATRGSYLTHHLLAYARKQTLEPRLVDLPPMLADVESLLGRTLGPGIAITVRTDAAARHARVDPGQIQTALLNLAINASHAMPDGGSLLIETRAVIEAGQPWVSIAVTDTGTGMDAQTLARAVEPFFSTKEANGTGLGLSMVQGFVEQSGGRLAIASVPGQGTTMTLYLPAASGPPGEVERPAPAAPAQSGCILLVDDDADVLVTTGAFLEQAGFTTIRATNADQALALLADGAGIDALVTDYAMPGMNGGDLVAEVRARRLGLPAVIITGFSDRADVAAWGEAVVMLQKPFRRALLIGRLHALLDARPPIAAVFSTLRPDPDEP